MRVFLDGAPKGFMPVTGGGEVSRQWILQINQHVVERGIIAKFGNKFDGLGKFFRPPKTAAAPEKFVQ